MRAQSMLVRAIEVQNRKETSLVSFDQFGLRLAFGHWYAVDVGLREVHKAPDHPFLSALMMDKLISAIGLCVRVAALADAAVHNYFLRHTRAAAT